MQSDGAQLRQKGVPRVPLMRTQPWKRGDSILDQRGVDLGQRRRFDATVDHANTDQRIEDEVVQSRGGLLGIRVWTLSR